MEEEKGVPMPTLATERTFTSLPPDQQDEEEEFWAGDERLGCRNVPYKEFVVNLAFPCAIGTAIAAGAAFSILAAGGIFGDGSQEAFDELRHITTLLAWSAGCYANATAIVVCLLFLYSSPSFCKVISQKINYTWKLRRKNEDWNLLRLIIAYGAVGAGFLSLLLQVAGTILMVEALRPFAPVLLAEVPISLVCVVGVGAYIGVILLERDGARERMKKVVRAASLPLPKLRRKSRQSDAPKIREREGCSGIDVNELIGTSISPYQDRNGLSVPAEREPLGPPRIVDPPPTVAVTAD
ncbi:hypothetical protein FRC04_004795 [Tulasnella sp. 424]|nr:hypothetical protein FRC04_004795 [Tulasnella sp. 424]